MVVHVLQAGSKRLDELAELAALTFPLACPTHVPEVAVQAFIDEHLRVENFAHYVEAPGYTVTVVADDDDHLVAYALCVDGTQVDPIAAESVRLRPTRGISKFYLHPDLHGSGVATALLQHLIADAARDQIRSLWLATNKGNVRARRFYQRHGFAIVGGRTFLVGGVENDDDVFELDLGT